MTEPNKTNSVICINRIDHPTIHFLKISSRQVLALNTDGSQREQVGNSTGDEINFAALRSIKGFSIVHHRNWTGSLSYQLHPTAV